MVDLQDQVEAAVARLRRARTDLHGIEAKAAAGGLPQSCIESVSAFANGSGGILLLGLDESNNFAAVEVDHERLAADLASACSDRLEPPVRPEIDIVVVDGMSIVAAVVDELPFAQKPCFVRTRGIERGSFLRTHDGDRVLTTYEVHVLLSARGQPQDDAQPVAGATVADLDEGLVAALLRRLRSTRGAVFANASDEQILRLMRVVVDCEGGQAVSLAGLLALGRYPQQFFPQLDVTFVAFPTVAGEPLADGTRFLDNQSIDGPIPTMVAMALTALRRNMKRRSVVAGLGREDRWEYPEEAIREIVANALMHRDYNALAHGTQVRIALYPDRIEFGSPGGLHGPLAREDLQSEPVSSSRNALLAKLLEDVEVPGTGRTVCENRGSGLLATAAALREAGLEPLELIDLVREFRVVVRNHGLLDDDAIRWLSEIDTTGLSDRQRLGLAFLHRHATVTNQQYRALTGCGALDATRDITGMAARGLVEKSNDRRWAKWHLVAGDMAPTSQPQLDFGEKSRPATRRGQTRGDRRGEIASLLSNGPLSTRDLANQLNMSPQGVRNWILRMEADGQVRGTVSNRKSPKNRWMLVT